MGLELRKKPAVIIHNASLIELRGNFDEIIVEDASKQIVSFIMPPDADPFTIHELYRVLREIYD